jgi:hypothetical protein
MSNELEDLIRLAPEEVYGHCEFGIGYYNDLTRTAIQRELAEERPLLHDFAFRGGRDPLAFAMKVSDQEHSIMKEADNDDSLPF